MSEIRSLPPRHQPKMLDICEQLKGLTLELGGGAKMPTVTQLRDSLVVSRGTLDKALGELERQQILSRVHGNGIFVSTRLGMKTIGLVHAMSESLGSPFWDLLLNEAHKRAEIGQEKFSFYLGGRGTDGHELPVELMSAVRAGRLQGLIFIGQPSEEALEWVREHRVPMVGFASFRTHYRVQLRAEMVPTRGVEYLAEQGCRRLGLWRPFGLWQRSAGYDENLLDYPALFEAALKRSGLPYAPECSWREAEQEAHWKDGELEGQSAIEHESLQEQGYHAVREVLGKLERPAWPDGLVLTNDVFARGVLVGLHRLGVAVGEEIQIVTHANAGSTMLLGYEDQISLLEFDPAAITGHLFGLLESLMNNDVPDEPICWMEPVLKEPAFVPFAL